MNPNYCPECGRATKEDYENDKSVCVLCGGVLGGANK